MRIGTSLPAYTVACSAYLPADAIEETQINEEKYHFSSNPLISGRSLRHLKCHYAKLWHRDSSLMTGFLYNL